MRCAGISRWAIVDPQTHDFETARRVAVHAEELLDRPAICTNLREALDGVALSVGTTARTRPERPLLSPREAARRMACTKGEVALVFGDERSGLLAEEVEAVDLVSSIPSAQAVAIYCWEVRAAALENQFVQTDRTLQTDPAALAAIDRALLDATAAIGKPGTRRRLYKALERARLSPREAALWTAFLTAVAKRPK
jgi:tRNA/rRNA methyltransferase